MSAAAGSYRTSRSSGPRRAVASSSSYADAERAVDFLADQDFRVERVAISGTGLRTVEQVAGRVTTGRAAMLGAAQGAVLGLLFGLLFGLFFTLDVGSFLGVVLYGLITGTLFGGVFGALAHSAQGGRRDFASLSGMQAERYEVQVDDAVAAQAEQLLERRPSA